MLYYLLHHKFRLHCHSE